MQLPDSDGRDEYWVKAEVSGPSLLITGTASYRRNPPLTATHVEPTTLTASWAADAHRLVIQGDRYGFVPLFVHVAPTSLTVATTPHALAAAGVRLSLDHGALAVMLRTGFFVGEDTAFAGVKVFPPGERWVWQQGALERAGGRPQPGAAFGGTRGEASRLYAGKFAAGLRSFADAAAPVIVPLSGGRDSRHILLELRARRAQGLRAVTLAHFPPKANDDAHIAALVCRALGVTHDIVDQPPPHARLATEREKNHRTGFTSLYHGWYPPLGHALPPGPLYVFDGIAGDVLSQSQYSSVNRLAAFAAGRLDWLATSILGSEGHLPALLSREFYAACSREAALARVGIELQRHQSAPNPVGQFYFWNRTRRAIAPAAFSLLPERVQVVMPFLEPGLYDFLATLPGGMLTDRRFHTDTIAAAYPEAATLPYEVKGTRRRDTTGYVRTLALHVLRTAACRPAAAPLWRRTFVAPRAARALIDAGYAPNLERLTRAVAYLVQLEQIARPR